jgi:hypothetical protein
MSLRQTLWVALLTAIYLCFELSFNARLLDVVGGAADESQIHAIERFGRSLSGIALALFVLQGLLTLKNHGAQSKPGGWILFAILGVTAIALAFVAASTVLPMIGSAVVASVAGIFALWISNQLRSRDCSGISTYFGMFLVCFMFATSAYFSLQKLTDYLTESSTPSFRLASYNIVLVQQALVEGKVRVDGLSDDIKIFSRPEGKAFLALFPVMAVSVEQLDEKIRGAKLGLIRDAVIKEMKGPARLYEKYIEAVKSIAAQWKQYDSAGNRRDTRDVGSRQGQAWDDYLRSLSKHGWTPYTVPDRYRRKVLRNVQAKIPVPDDWDLANETVFNAAVAHKAERATASKGDSVSFKGKRIPFGLTWQEFFAHPAVQGELRDRLGLPSQVTLRPVYRSGDEFERTVFDPVVDRISRQRLEIYDAPIEAFADHAKFADEGRRMAGVAIMPPLALFFSLLGALGHICKLTYLSLKAVLQIAYPGRSWLGYVFIVPLVSFISAGLVLHSMENDVTRSRLYGYLKQQVRSEDQLLSGAMEAALHMIAVGQGVFYPFDEKIRTDVLMGMSFGFHPN